MPSAFTHAFVATAIGAVMAPRHRWLIALGAASAVLPDADVIGFRFGIRYQDLLGHRGLSHSLFFAACLAAVLTPIVVRFAEPELSALRVGLLLFVVTASHGLLDAFTDGGLGVAFFAPFSGERWFFPWRPIVVAPISIHRFFSGRGLAVLASEFVVVWLPTIALWTLARLARVAGRD